MSQEPRIVRRHLCLVCSFSRDSFAVVLRHLGEVHSFEPGFRVVCGLGNNCPSVYTNFKSFRSHVYKKHRSILLPPATQNGDINWNESVQDLGGVATDYDDIAEDNGAEHNSAEVDPTRIAAMFILKTTEVHRVSQVL